MKQAVGFFHLRAAEDEGWERGGGWRKEGAIEEGPGAFVSLFLAP